MGYSLAQVFPMPPLYASEFSFLRLCLCALIGELNSCWCRTCSWWLLSHYAHAMTRALTNKVRLGLLTQC
jgi:hypothetical protein